MKVLFITTTFLPDVGGAECAIHHLANSMCKHGHDATVLNWASDKRFNNEALYTIKKYMPIRGSTKLGYHIFPFKHLYEYQLKKHIALIAPDIILAHFGWPVAFWLSSIKTDIPFSATCHGEDLYKIGSGPRSRFNIDHLLANSLNTGVAAIAISKYAKKTMLEIGVEERKIVHIPNGVDVEKYSEESSFNLRRFFNLPESAKVILSVGRNNFVKAYDVAIRAFSKTNFNNTYYIIVGSNTKIWKNFAEELGCGNRVITHEKLLGRDIVGAYQQCDIFTLPSIKELCPLVVPEAMAAGKPIIVTDVSGSQDMVKNMENGLVVKPGDEHELAQALETLLADEKLQQQFSQKNLELAPNYDWSIIAKKYLNCFTV